MFYEGTIYRPPSQVGAGAFKLLNPWEILQELKLMIQHIDVSDCIFRSNHASNYLMLKAHLPQEQKTLLATLAEVIKQNRGELLRPEMRRGL